MAWQSLCWAAADPHVLRGGKCDQALEPIGEKVSLTYWDVKSGRKTLEQRGDSKTGKVRTLGIPRFLRDMLTDHLEAIPADPDALVFTSPDGGPRRHDNFYRRHFKPAVRAALPAEKHGLRFHDLRHTCAAMLIAADAHPKAIQDHLGHKDIQTTFNVYGHMLASAQEALASRLDDVYCQHAMDNVRSPGGLHQ